MVIYGYLWLHDLQVTNKNHYPSFIYVLKDYEELFFQKFWGLHCRGEGTPFMKKSYESTK